MGTTLEGKQINQTYQGLLKTTDNNEVGVSAKEITDGKGNGTGVTLDNSGNIVANATVTANAFVGDGSQLTGLPVTSVNTQTGDVVLDADNISDTSTTNKFTTAADISKLADIEANADVTDIANVTTSLNSISATELSDITDVGSGSVITNVERTKLDGIEAGAEVNNINSVNGQVGTITLGLLNLDDVGTDGASGEVLTTDGQGNFTFQAAGGGEGLVTRINGATGNVVLDTDDIDEGTTNLYYTEARVSANTDVAANTAKVGITQSQADAIVANTAKTGITTEQANAIVANTAKVGITTQQANDILTNNAKVGITPTQANEITANTLKVGITTGQSDAIIANTAKNSYPSADATKVGHISVTQAVDLDTLESDVATNNAKVGITTQQADEIAANTLKTGITTEQADAIVANTAKVGITTQQADDIIANNAKISFDSTSSTKLAGIEDGAEVNVNADWNATTGDAQILNKPTLATVATSGSYTDLSNTPTIPTNNNELTNGAEYINEASQLAHTIAIGSAIDFSARVTLAGGVAEGTSGIIKNLQSIL